MITADQVKSIVPASNPTDELVVALNAAMTEFDISTTNRAASFIAQLAHESGNFSCMEENLNYRADALQRVWPTHFPTADVAAQYAHKPEAIANRAYADRMGNGDEASGDGWLYRGAGFIQLTGKENQAECADYFGIAVETLGEWLRTFYGAARSAGWFWQHHNINDYAD